MGTYQPKPVISVSLILVTLVPTLSKNQLTTPKKIIYYYLVLPTYLLIC